MHQRTDRPARGDLRGAVFVRGGALDLNIINYVIVFPGIVLLASPQAYVDELNEGIRTIGGILPQYPFCAGIMAAWRPSVSSTQSPL